MISRKFSTQIGFTAIFVGLITIFVVVTKPGSSSNQMEVSLYRSIAHVPFVSEKNHGISEKNEEIADGSPSKILCGDIIPRSSFEQRGGHWVLTNYFQATKTFHCDESITYTTHAEYSFLDNLIPLVERWQGPVSISVYSPGLDFNQALKVITYLRECSNTPLIKELVTFHLYFDAALMPKQKISLNSTAIKPNCKKNPMLTPVKQTYRRKAHLTYPVNMGRMIARDLATTHYVLASDIELYPNPGLILDFLDMIARDAPILHSPKPKVFVLPIFETDKSVKNLPRNKEELVKLLRTESVIPFHKNVCPRCHALPSIGKTNWTDAPFHDGYMNVYNVAKRQGPHKFWEPIYIGTKQDPGYDVRLNWEGQRDKMTQGYVLCLLDYEFHILDNAFLIHKPGIKYLSKRSKIELKFWDKQQKLIREKIAKELTSLYGKRQGCVLP